MEFARHTELGRFISPDPFVPQPGNPQALNRYSYVVNNPTNLVDPSGYFFGALFAFLGGLFTGVGEALGFNPLFTVGTFDTHAVAFGLGREIGLGFTGLFKEAFRIAGDFVLDRTLGPDRQPFSPQEVEKAIGQSVERNSEILPQDRALKTQERVGIFREGNGADITGSDLAEQLSHRNILQKILGGIGGLFTTHSLVGFGLFGLLVNPSGVGLTAQRIGNYVIFQAGDKILIQQENSGISSALGFVAHTVDLGQYLIRAAEGHITQRPTTGVTRGDAVTRSVLNRAERLRELPPLDFFQ